MPIMRITCPECGAALKSADGFAVGEEVECPKCATTFEVEKPVAAKTTTLAPSKTKTLSQKTTKLSAREDEDDKPKKKKKKKKRPDDDDEDWSYKNSWIRYAVLGVLLVVMAILGYFLYQKRQREKQDAAAPAPAPADTASTPRVGFGNGDPRMSPNNNKVTPRTGGQGGRPGEKEAVAFGRGGMALADALVPQGPTPQQLAAQNQKRFEDFKTRLLGNWKADLGGGATQVISYTGDGKFTDTTTGPGARKGAGTWKAAAMIGETGLTLERSGVPARVKVFFEGDELVHDTGVPGVSAVFRKV